MRSLDEFPVRDGFRQRGADITRLETFTDAAFAFAVTVLVIAGGQVPTTFDMFMDSLKEIPAFAGSFALIMMFWHGHVQWSRRFGLEDTRAVLLSAALIFTVLVYVVPLKVLFGNLFAWVSGGRLGQSLALTDITHLTSLFVVYGLGYIAMSIWMALLNAHAASQRERLTLNAHELFMTRVAMWQWFTLGIPGVLSVCLAGFAPPAIGMWSGFAYMLLPIVMPIFGIQVRRRLRALEGAQPARDAA